jgi:hypothetical protein
VPQLKQLVLNSLIFKILKYDSRTTLQIASWPRLGPRTHETIYSSAETTHLLWSVYVHTISHSPCALKLPSDFRPLPLKPAYAYDESPAPEPRKSVAIFRQYCCNRTTTRSDVSRYTTLYSTLSAASRFAFPTYTGTVFMKKNKKKHKKRQHTQIANTETDRL